MDKDNTQELLKVRYKVIADYPQGVFKFKVGEILMQKGIHFTGECKSINEGEIILYPHLFKKLEWWEDREEKDMPEYVKFVEDYMGYKKGSVYKTCPDWTGQKSTIFGVIIHFITDEKSEYGKAGVPAHFNQLMPATLEEFNNQNK